MTLPELAEDVFRAYEVSLDIDLACRRSGLSEEEQSAIMADPSFQARIDGTLFEVQEELFGNLRELAASGSESVRLQATMRLGEMVYAQRFAGEASGGGHNSRTPIVLVGSDEG